MSILVPTLLTVLIGSVSCYDCYDQKCEGTGYNAGTYIHCDQEFRYCGTDYYGSPVCNYGYSGNGVYCNGSYTDQYTCESFSYTGKAYCGHYVFPVITVVPSVIGAVILIGIIACCIRCCRRRRYVTRQQTVVVQQTVVAPAPPRPTVVQNINVVPAPAQPICNNQPNYGAAGYYNPGYPAQQGGYPAQQGGYPAQQGGYPTQQGGYPAQQGGYPAQQGGYPAQQGGYPTQQGGYPAQQGGYPAQQGGYTQQGNFAEQPPPYDANAPTSPPKNEFPTNPNYQGDP